MQQVARQKICLVTTSLLIVKFFLTTIIRELSVHYDVTLVVNVDNKKFLSDLNLPVRVVHIPIERNISIYKDVKALFLLGRFLAREKFVLIHTIAPKAGIVGILAAWLTRIPNRIHVYQGEVWSTQSGLLKFILKSVDKLVGLLATKILVVSESERNFLISERVIPSNKSRVLASGSICGVDMNRFKSDLNSRKKIRSELGIGANDFVFVYIGRLNRDKGVLELVQSFSRIKTEDSNALHLVIVGPDEENIVTECSRFIGIDEQARIHFVPYTDHPELYLAGGDVLILPSHREGFGLVIIEAAAMKIPAIGARIYGITDAIEEGKTGLLFKVTDIVDLTEKMQLFIKDDSLREKMGEAAFDRCAKKFAQNTVIEATLRYYEEILV